MGALDLPDGQQLARTLWGTRASGEAFDRKKSSYLTEQARTFIEQQSFCIVAGVDFHHELGGLVVPGEAGFVQMPDEQTCWLSLPCSLSTTRLGRKLLQSNEKSQPARLGLFFISHPTRERLCVHGTMTSLSSAPSNATAINRAILIHLRVHHSFFHCAKYIKTRVPGLTSPAEVCEVRTWRVQHLLNHTQSCLTEELCAYVAEHALCYLCTVDWHGQPAVNHRGGAPGFLVATLPDSVHPRGQILLPDYSGNGAFEAMGNILETGKAYLIVPDYAAQLALCISGWARVMELYELAPELAQQCAGAERVIALSVGRVETQAGNWSAALAAERSRAEVVEILVDGAISCPV